VSINLGFLVIMVMTQGYEVCDITLPYIIYEPLAYVFYIVSVLKLEAAVSSETSVCSYHITWHNIPEDKLDTSYYKF